MAGATTGTPGGTHGVDARFIGTALVTPFIAAVSGFLIAGVVSGAGTDVVSALIEQASARRLNPLIAGGLGLAPVLLLLLILTLGPRWVPGVGWGRTAAWGGLAAIAALEFWAHWEVWTTYFPSRAMPGFPHGLEFVIVPLFFAPVGMLVGLGAGLLRDRSIAKSARGTPPGDDGSS